MMADPQTALRLRWRLFSFSLPEAMITAHGALKQKQGCLLRLESPDGAVGWGEAAPCSAEAISGLGETLPRGEIEARLPWLPRPLAFAIGLALAELDGLGAPSGAGWLPPPPSAVLLPAGEAALPALNLAMKDPAETSFPAPGPPFTVKWKVAVHPDPIERRVLERILQQLPSRSRLRLDANGGWDRPTAWAWAHHLQGDPRLEWLEQPLDPADRDGLEALADLVPVALDESLRLDPGLCTTWEGWQVRRPALEGDPRPLLAALTRGSPRLMLSTALETGIGARMVSHLAALQQKGPTPAAPGLAPGWRPQGTLFAGDPLQVWEAAA
jgi:O-succinylbenzoate synthase